MSGVVSLKLLLELVVLQVLCQNRLYTGAFGGSKENKTLWSWAMFVVLKCICLKPDPSKGVPISYMNHEWTRLF